MWLTAGPGFPICMWGSVTGGTATITPPPSPPG
jgi:hypothetical protein